jgi:hypothetical protein
MSLIAQKYDQDSPEDTHVSLSKRSYWIQVSVEYSATSSVSRQNSAYLKTKDELETIWKLRFIVLVFNIKGGTQTEGV